MRLYSFVMCHAVVLLSALLPPKFVKADKLGELPNFWAGVRICIPDIAIVLALELLLLGIAHGSPRILRRLLGIFWTFLAVPAVIFAVFDYRFFSITKTPLDWELVSYALSNAAELEGLILSELDWGSGLLMAGAFLLGIYGCIFVWKAVGDMRWRPGLGLGMLLSSGVILSLVLSSWANSALAGTEAASVRGNLYVAFASEALFPSEAVEDDRASDLVDVELPKPIKLTIGGKAPIEDGASGSPYNIVIFVLESLRAEATTPYSDWPTTPFLNRIAQEGMMATDVYTVIPHTTKSLVPILCGIQPDIRQSLTETIAGGLPIACLAELLEPLGYKTAFFQSARENFENRTGLVSNMGYDEFYPMERLENYKDWERVNFWGVEDRALVKPMLSWLDKQDSPFFLSVLNVTTHYKYNVPSTFESKEYTDHESFNKYLNTIRYTDGVLEEIFQGFADRGLLENTLFVFIGDHGEAHEEHGLKGHDGGVYEEMMRVPLLFWNPVLIPEHKVITGRRRNIDTLPTVLDLVGISLESGELEGQSLLGPQKDDGDIFGSCWYENRCITGIFDDTKIIYRQTSRISEIFDLAKDPLEKKDIRRTVDEGWLQERIDEMLEWRRHRRRLYATHRRYRNSEYVMHEPPNPEFPLDANFGGRFDVEGYAVEGEVYPGRKITLVLYVHVLDYAEYWRFKLGIIDGKSHFRRIIPKSIDDTDPVKSWVPGNWMRVPFEFHVPFHARSGPGKITVQVGRGDRRYPVLGEGPEVNQLKKRLEIPIEIKGL